MSLWLALSPAGPPGLEIQQSVVQVNPSHRLFLPQPRKLRPAVAQPEFFEVAGKNRTDPRQYKHHSS